MRSGSRIEWWRRRRVRWPLGGLLAVATAVAVAIFRSGSSRIVVSNETGGEIPELSVAACGQSRVFRQIAERESVRLELAPRGGESDILLSTNGVPMWRGEFVEPRGGYRAILRLRRDGRVDASVTLSWWQNLFPSRESQTQ